MFVRKRVYILVKTYPTISRKYAELVCTAGILEDGSWIRLYPIPFRLLEDDQKFPKYTWIEVDVERNTKDFRPESYRPDISTLSVEPKPHKVDWGARNSILFKNTPVYTNLQTLISEAKSCDSYTSLAIFKPTKILNFVIEPDKREWDPEKLESLQAQSRQLQLFKTIEEIEEEYQVVKKIPYKFSYTFLDDEGKRSKLMIEDWEIGMLYLNCLCRAKNNEDIAVQKVKEKYYNEFLEKDLYFFLGTTMQYHLKSPNPFIIVGVYYPPHSTGYQQMSLLDLT